MPVSMGLFAGKVGELKRLVKFWQRLRGVEEDKKLVDEERMVASRYGSREAVLLARRTRRNVKGMRNNAW